MDLRDRFISPAQLLALVVLALLGLGVVMVESASMSVDAGPSLSWADRGFRQLVFAAVSMGAFAAAAFLPVDRLLRLGPVALGVSLLACVAVLIPGVGTEVNGAVRWIRLGPVQVQPSELAKWSGVIMLAWLLGERKLDLSRFQAFVVACVPIGVACLLVVIEDFGTAALIGVVGFAMLLVGGARLWHLLVCLPPVMAAAVYFVAGTPYRMARMTAFLDPWRDAQGTGYHMVQSLMSFASGGLTGRGLGNGVQKLGYLPEDTTDFIFAVVAEELGLAGCASVILLFVVVGFLAWQAVRRGDSDARKLLAFGIGLTVLLQAVVNVGVATVSMPTKGMSLPLVSAGGTGMILTAAMLGLLANLLRTRRE